MTPTRLVARPQERDGAVDATAHRDRDPVGRGRRDEHLRERVRERVGGQRLARHRGRLQQRQPCERPSKPGRVGVENPVTLDGEPHECEVAPAR